MTKLVYWLIVFSLVVAIECLVSSSKKFNCVEQGVRFTGGVLKQITKLSLLECAIECSKSAECTSFQFTRPSLESSSESSCLFLDQYDSFSLTTNDPASNIYQLDYATISVKEAAAPSETTTATTTTTTTSATTSVSSARVYQTTTTNLKYMKNVCNYANETANFTCTCSSSDFCTGVLQCSANITGSTVSYYLDRTTMATYSTAEQKCKTLNMGIITVKSKAEQSTICQILLKAVGTQVQEGFWMGLTRNDDSISIQSSSWIYSDGTSLGKYRPWYMLDNLPGLCATIVGSSENFTWDPYNCNSQGSSSSRKMRILCTSVSN